MAKAVRVLPILLPLALVFAGCVREEASTKGDNTDSTACPDGFHRMPGDEANSSQHGQHGTPGVGGCVANQTGNASAEG